MGGVPITEDKTQVFIAATSSRLATEFMEKGGGYLQQRQNRRWHRLTLALAKERKIDGVSLLGYNYGF
jgi:proteasome assembly chaperone (PAC2) family protein